MSRSLRAAWRAAVLAAVAFALAPGAAAQGIDLPAGARQAAADPAGDPRGSLPSGPWRDGAVPMLPSPGGAARTAWRIQGTSPTTAQIAGTIRDGLVRDGYDIAFDCRDDACGGFDFRFAAGLLPAPGMYVDLGDYIYLLAVRGGAAPEAAAGILVSRSGDAGHVHLSSWPAAAPAAMRPAVAAATVTDASPDADGPVATLLERGHVALDDVDFPSGSATLSEGTYPSLVALAEWLAADDARRIVLVGHTDADGALAGNVALSRRRSAAVAARLSDLGAPDAQVASDGIGYLAPRAANATDAGRRANRRVEAVLLP